MKRVVYLAVIALISLMLFMTAEGALAAQSGDYYYEDNGDGTCTITAYVGKAGYPVFPETLNSLTVTGIGEKVFRLHSGSQSYMSVSGVTIPDTVTTIAANAFDDCGNMEIIHLGSGLESIGENAFSGCNKLQNISIADLKKWVDLSAGSKFSCAYNLYFGDKLVWSSTDYKYVGDELVESVTIPGDIAEIPPCLFQNCISLKEAVISEGVTKIGRSAFQNCLYLESVKIPSTMTDIDTMAFCINGTRFNSVYAASPESWLGMKVGSSAFTTYYDLYFDGVKAESITIPKAIVSIGDNAFIRCSSLTEVSIHDNVISVGASAFERCIGLTGITIPDSVESIGNSAFANCSALKTVDFYGTAPDAMDGTGIFRGVTATVTYQQGDSWDGKIQDYGGVLTWERMGETLSGDIEWYVTDDYSLHIYGTGEMTSDMGSKWQSGYYADKIAHVYVGEDLSFVNTAWFDKDVFPGLQYLHFGSTCRDVRYDNFENVGIYCNGDVSESIAWEYTPDGKLSITGSGEIPDYGDFDAPWYALNQWGYIKSIDISDDITRIGSCAFYYCSAQSVHLPENLTALGHDAFYGGALTSVSIPDGVSIIPSSCFSCNYSLTGVKMPAGLKTLGAYAFCNAPLKTLELPEGLETIGDGAFTCAEINEVTIPNTVSSIGAGAFGDCERLCSVTIPHTVTNIDKDAFKNFRDGLTLFSHEDSPAAKFAESNGIGAVLELHDPSVIPGSAPTCLEEGTSDGSMCTICKLMLSEQTTIPATGHSYADPVFDWEEDGSACAAAFSCIACGDELTLDAEITSEQIAEPDCVTPGKTEYKAAVIFGEEEITDPENPEATVTQPKSHTDTLIIADVPPLGHTGEADKGVPATHVTTGLTEGEHCSVCGDIIVAQEVIPVVEVSSVLTLPASLKVIDEAAFNGGTFSCVVVPDGCTHIGASAFAGCSQLQFIEIPASVMDIDDTAFDGRSDALIIVTTAGSEAEAFAGSHGILCIIR